MTVGGGKTQSACLLGRYEQKELVYASTKHFFSACVGGQCVSPPMQASAKSVMMVNYSYTMQSLPSVHHKWIEYDNFCFHSHCK